MIRAIKWVKSLTIWQAKKEDTSDKAHLCEVLPTHSFETFTTRKVALMPSTLLGILERASIEVYLHLLAVSCVFKCVTPDILGLAAAFHKVLSVCATHVAARA